MKDLRYPETEVVAEEPPPPAIEAEPVVAKAPDPPPETVEAELEPVPDLPSEPVAKAAETPIVESQLIGDEEPAKAATDQTDVVAKPDAETEPAVVPPPVLPATRPRELSRFALEAEELSVGTRGAARPELDRISLKIERGETAVLFGEPQCGKEALLRAVAGALAPHEAVSGKLTLGGEDRAHTALRVAYLPGPFLKPLSPHASTAEQLSRIVARKLGVPQSAALQDLRAALERIDGAPPFEALSATAATLAPDALAYGLLATAMTQTPDVLLVEHFVADLPLMQARQLIAALKAEQQRLGFALLYSARGAHVVNWLEGRVIVLRQGRIVEEGTVARLASGASHAYTRMLFQALPRISTDAPARAVPRGEPLLQVRGLELAASGKNALTLSREGLTFELRRGASLALVGEEGSGRRKLARALIGLEHPGSGRIVLDSVDIGVLSESMRHRMRRRVALIVGTDTVLDERMTVWDTVAEPLRAHLNPSRDVLATQTEGALKRVGLAAMARSIIVRRLSAFDRRRLQIARAIITQPHIAIIEEPLRGLDAFAQGVVRDLLREFRRTEGPAFLVVTADFSVADALAEEAFVFRDGRVIERGPLAQILKNPKELATRNLIAAVAAAALPRGGVTV